MCYRYNKKGHIVTLCPEKNQETGLVAESCTEVLYDEEKQYKYLDDVDFLEHDMIFSPKIGEAEEDYYVGFLAPGSEQWIFKLLLYVIYTEVWHYKA
jgi:hypothetical protein